MDGTAYTGMFFLGDQPSTFVWVADPLRCDIVDRMPRAVPSSSPLWRVIGVRTGKLKKPKSKISRWRNWVGSPAWIRFELLRLETRPARTTPSVLSSMRSAQDRRAHPNWLPTQAGSISNRDIEPFLNFRG